MSIAGSVVADFCLHRFAQESRNIVGETDWPRTILTLMALTATRALFAPAPLAIGPGFAFRPLFAFRARFAIRAWRPFRNRRAFGSRFTFRSRFPFVPWFRRPRTAITDTLAFAVVAAAAAFRPITARRPWFTRLTRFTGIALFVEIGHRPSRDFGLITRIRR